MIKALNFVKGAVAKKGFTPELTHFRIQNGTIMGYNGGLALSSPIALDIEASPKAITFVKAITACRATTVMSLTTAGRLSIRSGKFRAFVECLDTVFPDIVPEGKMIPLTGSFISVLKKLSPFMAQDASRPWARGIMLKGQSAYVTNNIIMIEAWMKTPFPVIANIPAQAIKELVRIKEDPISLQLSDTSITFHYEDGKWLRSALSTLDWPDISPILDRECSPQMIPEGLLEALDDLKPFVDEAGRIIFSEGAIRTSLHEGVGASTEIEGLPDAGTYNIEQLALLKGIIKSIDFSQHPNPCLFFGDELRGAIVGMRS